MSATMVGRLDELEADLIAHRRAHRRGPARATDLVELDGPDSIHTFEQERVDAKEFWLSLEFRIRREMWGFGGEDRHLRGMWCDGIVPDEYDLAGDEPQIRGDAYFGYSGQEIWRFTLMVGQGIESPEQID